MVDVQLGVGEAYAGRPEAAVLSAPGFEVVLLVVLFGGEEVPKWFDLGNDFDSYSALIEGLLVRRLGLLGCFLLRRRRVVYARPVLSAGIVALTVQSGWVMQLPKIFQKRPEGAKTRIVDDFHHFNVIRLARTHFLVSWVLSGALRVPNESREDAVSWRFGQSREVALAAPEASHSERNRFHPFGIRA